MQDVTEYGFNSSMTSPKLYWYDITSALLIWHHFSSIYMTSLQLYLY